MPYLISMVPGGAVYQYAESHNPARGMVELKDIVQVIVIISSKPAKLIRGQAVLDACGYVYTE